MKKQVYTHEKELTLPNNSATIVLSISKYTDSLLLFINQTGAIGSILEGVATESTAQLLQDDFDNENLGNSVGALGRSNFIYNIRVLFGSTEIEFYQLLLRRVMGVVWEEMKVTSLAKVVANISLPVLHPSFKVEDYYGLLVEECRAGLKTVL